MNKNSKSFFDIALSRNVVFSAFKVALLVGTALAFINHGDALLRMDINIKRLSQIILTYIVPYGVSTYSSVKAIERHE